MASSPICTGLVAPWLSALCLQLLVLKLTDQNVQMIKLFNHYDQSLIENQILHQELENVRNETTKKEMESRHLLQKWNEAKVLLQLFCPAFYVITNFMILINHVVNLNTFLTNTEPLWWLIYSFIYPII